MSQRRLCRKAIIDPMTYRCTASAQTEMPRERRRKEIRGAGQQYDLVAGGEMLLETRDHKGAQLGYQETGDEFRGAFLDPSALQTSQVGLILACHVRAEAHNITQQKFTRSPPLHRTEDMLVLQLGYEATFRTGGVDQGTVEVNQYQPFNPCFRRH
jgi:hypothetical protein